MAHFYGTVIGRRLGISTRCGDASTGLIATANGWTIGGTVSVSYNPTTKSDEVTFHLTKGSRDRTSTTIASYTILNGSLVELDKPTR
jgi:hypothetical protein